MQVGDYVRTNKGIARIIGKNDDVRYTYPDAWETDTYLEIVDDTEYLYDEDIIKSSPNIIDVLEEHDFVQMQDRGNRFYEIERYYTGKLSLRDIGWDEYEELDETNIPEIVSIITHEQMEQMKYEV